MDEYERAASELKLLIEQSSDHKYARIIDAQTNDEACRPRRFLDGRASRDYFGLTGARGILRIAVSR